MTSPPGRDAPSAATAVLEGTAAGAGAGAVLLVLERSPTFHIFADVLNALFRLLSDRLSAAVLVRLDTPAVAVALYVGGHALLGAAIGGALGLAGARLGRPRTGLRRLLIPLLLLVADVVVFGAVWRHRALPFGAGVALLGLSTLVATAAVVILGPALERGLRGGPRRAVAGLLPAAIAVAIGITLAEAAGGPSRPEGRTVAYPQREPTGVKVAILGLDGLDWNLVDEAIAGGRMPNLARLLREGIRGDLRSIRPPKSPVVWTSIATGVLPDRHGITDFVVRREGRSVPVTSNLRRVPALWNMARDAAFRVAFVNWYVTWPAEEVPGVMVSDRVDFDGLDRRVSPEGLLARVDAARARVDDRPDRDIARFTDVGPGFAAWRAERWGQVRRALSILDDVVRHDLVTIESARVALDDGQPDVTALYFRGNDNTQHLFWKYRLAARDDVGGLLWDGLDPGDVQRLSGVVDRYYDFVDALVGEALGLLEPDTALLLLSDHGFLASNERNRWYHANRLLAEAGLASLVPGSGGVADSATSLVRDPDPPSTSPRRELRPGGAARDAGAALDRAREVLAAARTDRGAPVFRRLEIDDDAGGPRLVAVFDPDLSLESATVAGRKLPREAFLSPEGHSGDHRMDGFLLAWGGPFRSGETIEGARAVDIAPTVLHLVGAPAARDMEGAVLVDLFEPAWMTSHPVRYVETYGPRDVDESGAIETGADEKIREELQALGYIQ